MNSFPILIHDFVQKATNAGITGVIGINVECEGENEIPESVVSKQRLHEIEERRHWLENLHAKAHSTFEIVRLAILYEQGNN